MILLKGGKFMRQRRFFALFAAFLILLIFVGAALHSHEGHSEGSACFFCALGERISVIAISLLSLFTLLSSGGAADLGKSKKPLSRAPSFFPLLC